MNTFFQSNIEKILRLLYQNLQYDLTFVSFYFSIRSPQSHGKCSISNAHILYHFDPPVAYINSSNALKCFMRQSFLRERGHNGNILFGPKNIPLRHISPENEMGYLHKLQNQQKNRICSPGFCKKKSLKEKWGLDSFQLIIVSFVLKIDIISLSVVQSGQLLDFKEP